MEITSSPSESGLIADLQRQVQELREANARLKELSSERLIARVAELTTLQKINSAANSSLNLGQMLALTTETVADVVKAEFCSIFLVESRSKLVLRATKGLNPEAVGRVSMRVGQGITGAAAREGRAITVQDAKSDPRFHYNPLLHEEACQSMLSVPMILYSQQRLTGVLNIQTLTPRDFTEDEIRFVEMVAGQVAVAIENARAYQQTDQKLHQRIEELVTLHRVSNLIASTLDVRKVLDLIVVQAVSLSNADIAVIFLLEESGENIWVPAAHGQAVSWVGKWRMKARDSEIGRAISTGQPIVVPDLQSDPLLQAAAPVTADGGYRSLALLPLTTRNRTIGSLAVCGVAPHDFSDDEMRLLSIFADQAAIAIDNARLFEESQRNLAVQTTLLSEMHHRVKNNLQTVAALLSLQARRAPTWEMAVPFRESVARIESIAAVHELLSQHQIGHVKVEDVTRSVTDVAMLSPVRPGTKVDFQIDGGDVILGSREATIFALLLNELITNAVAHGFADRIEGMITVCARIEGEDTVVSVHDNGKGLPEGFVLERDAGLGLQIVSTLVETDLRGHFEISADGEGTLATVAFHQ